VPKCALVGRFYGREIAAYDIQTKRVDIYGQSEGYTERAFLLYDGLHYDAMAQTGDPSLSVESTGWMLHSVWRRKRHTEL